MKPIVRRVLFVTMILYACAPNLLPPVREPAISTETDFAVPPTVGAPHTDQPTVPDRPTAPPGPQDCGYQWASQDLPELADSFRESIQMLQPEAEASAFAFGENCLRTDGSVARFIAMETDFNVSLRVRDAADQSELGDWIMEVMRVIETIPPEQIAGPRPGRVTLSFQATGAEEHIIFYRNQYEALPAGLSAAQIYQALKIPQ